MESFLYFAYGSNMLLRRLRARTPSATAVATGFVAGRRLTFHKVGRDGSGKCDMAATGSTADRVYGVLFRIARSEREALDRAEGLDHGYREEHIPVQRDDGTTTVAMAYIATHIDSALRPFDWYKSLVVSGAAENGLPPPYVEWLGTIHSQPDPDPERREANGQLLISRE